MAVEIGWFIVLPVLRELGVWWQRRGALRWNRHSLRTAAVAAAAPLLVLLPWQHSVSAPAVLMRDKAQGVYAAHAAMIAHVDLRDGQHVSAGQVLAQLTSPELDDQLRETAIREDMLRWEVQQQPFNDELRQLGPALRKRWETQREALDGLHAQIAQLTLRAPFDGRIADVDPELRDGVWLPAGARLFTVIGDAGRDGGVRGEAYVGESALARIRDGAAAEFISDLPEQGARSCRVSGIDRVNLATLDTLYPASVYGGAIPSRKKTDGEVLPLDTRFRVRFDHCAGGDALNREMPGRALVRGRAESIAGHAVRWLAAVARREATP
jgi:putative peptide zinc metalloprotease protein